jgi:hypothetical protein
VQRYQGGEIFCGPIDDGVVIFGATGLTTTVGFFREGMCCQETKTTQLLYRRLFDCFGDRSRRTLKSDT